MEQSPIPVVENFAAGVDEFGAAGDAGRSISLQDLGAPSFDRVVILAEGMSVEMANTVLSEAAAELSTAEVPAHGSVLIFVKDRTAVALATDVSGRISARQTSFSNGAVLFAQSAGLSVVELRDSDA